jgi:hypothetical protein
VTSWVVQNVNYNQVDIRKYLDKLYQNEYFMSSMKEMRWRSGFKALTPEYRFEGRKRCQWMNLKRIPYLITELFDHGDHHDHEHHHDHAMTMLTIMIMTTTTIMDILMNIRTFHR